jgi:hypothetical protein
MKARALANNNVAFLAWGYEQPIPGCLGFAIYRKDTKTRQETPLSAWVPFCPQSNPEWKRGTTEKWPIQKFSWLDLTAPTGGTYTYRIVPMLG